MDDANSREENKALHLCNQLNRLGVRRRVLRGLWIIRGARAVLDNWLFCRGVYRQVHLSRSPRIFGMKTINAVDNRFVRYLDIDFSALPQ